MSAFKFALNRSKKLKTILSLTSTILYLFKRKMTDESYLFNKAI